MTVQHELPSERKDGRGESGARKAPLLSIESAIVKNVRVSLHARLGKVEMSIEELLALEAGSVLTLDLRMNELVELILDDQPVARGEIVAVDDNFGIRIVEIAELK
ncbi:MAG TPA: FliM/FliN family flagellar motor switch protein [Allosphingosinicella sp.]